MKSLKFKVQSSRLLLILIAAFISVQTFAQSSYKADNLIANQSVKVNGRRATGISNDSTATNKDSTKLITEAAAKKYADKVVKDTAAVFRGLMSSTPSYLSTLLDVNIADPLSGQVLKYNGTQWYNGTDLTGGGGGNYTPSLLNAKNCGATGDGSTDDYAALQHGIDSCIANGIEQFFIPKGNYKISHPLIIRKINAGARLDVFGEGNFWNNETQIFTTYRNTFAIGIQIGKGVKIRQLAILGLFTPPYGYGETFFNTVFSAFTDGVSRDQQYSPYAGIVIDPFRNTVADGLPPDGGYPGLSSQYGLNTSLSSTSGSTATVLEDLNISNFVVGICSSPNGTTSNAEISLFNRIQITNCKAGISGGQTQEKANRIDNLICWGGTHTLFTNHDYGVLQPGNWNGKNWNIAGYVNRIFNLVNGSFFSCNFEDIYAESLGSIGTISSNMPVTLKNCEIDFESQSTTGVRSILDEAGERLFISGGHLRFYGEAGPIYFSGSPKFFGVNFSGTPYKTNSDGHVPDFKNCSGDLGDDISNTTSNTFYLYGPARSLQIGTGSASSQFQQYIDFPEYKKVSDIINIGYTAPITSLSSRSITITPGSSTSFFQVGYGVYLNPTSGSSTGKYGAVTANDGTNVTINYIQDGYDATVTHNMYVVVPLKFNGTFLGDVTDAHTITNVATDLNADPTSYVGQYLKLGIGIDGFGFITNYNSGTKTFTVYGQYDQGFISSQYGTQYFACGGVKKFESQSGFDETLNGSSNNYILQKGGTVTELARTDFAKKYIVTQSGYNVLPGGETRKALWQLADGSSVQSLTDGSTITMNVLSGNTGNVTLGGNRTFTLTGMPSGKSGYFVVNILQDGTGSRTITWSNTIHWKGGVPPTLQTSSGALDVISFEWNGTYLIGNYSSY